MQQTSLAWRGQLSFVFLAPLFLFATTNPSRAEQRPNIIVIMADDEGLS